MSTQTMLEEPAALSTAIHQEPASEPTAASEPPPPPIPSSDPGLAVDSPPSPPPDENDDLFRLSPRTALKLLAAGLDVLVRVTGDIPPTPPPTSPTIPNMRGMQAEKESIVRSHSQRSLARLRQQAEADAAASTCPVPADAERPSNTPSTSARQPAGNPPTAAASHLIDGVRLRAQTPTPTGTGPATSTPPEPYIIIGADAQPLNLQHSAIARKFYGKQPPRVTVEEYLTRLHRYCPMSTAVYLATSLYIHRLAVEERAIPVTRRNVHRLVLGGLRVAMKALEDQNYSHVKMAKVGGVSEAELARLEIHFCFLTNFELAVGEEVLRRHWETLRDGRSLGVLASANVPVLRLERRGSRPKGDEKENVEEG